MKYNGLLEADFNKYKNALKSVNTVTFYDPSVSKTVTVNMKTTSIHSVKVYYKHDVSVWNLSFDLQEL